MWRRRVEPSYVAEIGPSRGLVESSKVGRQQLYRLAPDGLNRLQAALDEISLFWTTALDRAMLPARLSRRSTSSPLRPLMILTGTVSLREVRIYAGLEDLSARQPWAGRKS